MAEPAPRTNLSITRLILVPSLITFLITILRLFGELQHWSPQLFNASPGGGGAIIGIVWLPFLFGPYFAIRLWGVGQGPKSAWKAVGFALLALLASVVASFVGWVPVVRIPGRELWGYVLMIVAAGLVLPGWPALFKALTAYAYAARIPVAIIMFFAIRGNWGTHYDALPPGYAGPTILFPKFVQLGLLPQMILWVVYTIIVGALIGSVVAGVLRRLKAARGEN